MFHLQPSQHPNCWRGHIWHHKHQRLFVHLNSLAQTWTGRQVLPVAHPAFPRRQPLSQPGLLSLSAGLKTVRSCFQAMCPPCQRLFQLLPCGAPWTGPPAPSCLGHGALPPGKEFLQGGPLDLARLPGGQQPERTACKSRLLFLWANSVVPSPAKVNIAAVYSVSMLLLPATGRT